ncbi:MAG: 4a-hydroxytetrahydrobiopterin dehydratase [Gammaproteobacteria bacterium]|nr:4a-hydroxytetrahydrobiopterin dehydratase [Gammaproteobacteria bacterium]
MKKPVLTGNDLDIAVSSIHSGTDSAQPWQVINGKLHKTFVFTSFIEAFAFMTQSALESEKMNHHPEWSNVYKTVVVDLVTHHSNGITELDIELARKMEAFCQCKLH